MKTLSVFSICLLTSLSLFGQNPNEQDEDYVLERLPEWFIKDNPLDGLVLNEDYIFDNRLNPLYLEADFNGDSYLDVAFPIKNRKTEASGFAIFHGNSKDVFIIGAGIKITNGLSDDHHYIDIWKVNYENINEPGLDERTGTGEKGELILVNPSIKIEKSEVGGGIIYWNGNEYAYFHQTC